MTLDEIEKNKYDTEGKAFLVYPSYANAGNRLADAEFGKFCRVLFHYGFTGERVESGNIIVDAILDIIQPIIDANEEKYANTCFRNRKNAEKSKDSENNGRPSLLDNEEYAEEFKKSYSDGMSVSELASKYHISVKTAQRHIIKLGLDKTRQNPTKPLNDNDTNTDTNNYTDTNNNTDTIKESEYEYKSDKESDINTDTIKDSKYDNGYEEDNDSDAVERFDNDIDMLKNYFDERVLEKLRQILVDKDYEHYVVSIRDMVRSKKYDKDEIEIYLLQYLPISKVDENKIAELTYELEKPIETIVANINRYKQAKLEQDDKQPDLPF